MTEFFNFMGNMVRKDLLALAYIQEPYGSREYYSIIVSLKDTQRDQSFGRFNTLGEATAAIYNAFGMDRPNVGGLVGSGRWDAGVNAIYDEPQQATERGYYIRDVPVSQGIQLARTEPGTVNYVGSVPTGSVTRGTRRDHD